MAAWRVPPNANGLKVVLRLGLERSGRVSEVRVEKSSGDKQFDALGVAAVRHAGPFPPVPESAKSLVGDLRMALDSTRPVSARSLPTFKNICIKQKPQHKNRTCGRAFPTDAWAE